MLLTLLVAIVAQSIDPVEAGCRLTAHGIEGRRTAPTSLSVECPRDVVDADYLQQLAEYSIGLVPLDIDRHSYVEIATSIWFEWREGESWSAIPGQLVFPVTLQISPRLVERGGRQQACSYAFWPDRRGVPVNAEIACSVDGRAVRSGIRYVDRPMMTAIENARLLPVETIYCFQDRIHVRASVNGAPPPPLVEPDLPLLCESEE
jgi:hypothetical protein